MEEISIEIIYKKMENRLSEEEQRIFEKWVKEPAHRKYFERMRRFYDLEVENVSREGEVDAGWEIFQTRLSRQKKLRLRKRIYRVATIAAAVSVMLGGLHLFSLKQDKKTERVEILPIRPGQAHAMLELADGKVYDLKKCEEKRIADHILLDSNFLTYAKKLQPAEHIPGYNKLIVPRGGEFQISLEDGTKVWLNSDSHLKYPEYFGEKERKIFLQGEAYFEVARDSSRPFSVYAGDQKVTVLGTCFGITSYPREVQTTTLVSGKVKVEFPELKEQVYFLEPGYQIAYDAEKQVMQHKAVSVGEFVSWKDGKYVFNKKPLETILNTLARWYDFEVFYRSSGVKKVLFSGELMRFENFSDILKAIEKSSDVRFEVQNRTVVVSK